MIRLKVCCISSPEEARLAIAARADALGLVGPMPSGPGVIDDALSAQIARLTPPPVATFLLTSETSAEALIAHVRRVQPTTLQLVDAVKPGVYSQLREAFPALKLVQVLHVLDERQLDEALAAAPHVDALLLDSGNPTLAVKELGGTGRVHNWAVSRKIVEQSGVPVFLAGGLNIGNIRQAIDTVNPFGIDVCSGVRTGGKLDAEKLAA
ncbi:MAG: phosphoribosylanthranilate isomerase, partial [Sphingobacteriaceae bacterium]|nr:phosphoribosylanthranilate isomerase [Cytophagaceae bacterium]